MSAARKKPSSEDSSPAARPGVVAKKPSLRRRLTFRLATATLIPALFLCVVELSLRGCGYGYRTNFFRSIRNHDAYEGNPRFGWRFFPRSLARAPALMYLPGTKAPGTCRVFVLGGSAAMGIPDEAYGFGRMLEVMLGKVYPETRFEVINAAMTAINSHAVVDIMRDCAAHEPDLFLVYLGNNEVVGPFGPGTVFHGFTSRRATIRASLWAKKMKIGQLLENAGRRAAGEDQRPGDWRGMEMFLERRVPADAPALESTYEHFRANLKDICDSARDADAKVVVATVAVNLKDCAPFATVFRSDLTEAEKVEWEAAYRAGVAAEESGRFTEALERYAAAAQIDNGFAELHYRLGRCYSCLDKVPEAYTQFSLARDLDALRFRADSRINSIIREFAAGREAEGVWLADAELALREDVRGGLPGDRHFFEHVHLTFEGNHDLARAFFPKVVAALCDAGLVGKPVDQEPPSLARCAELLVFTEYDRAHMLEKMLTMTGNAPFTNRLDNDTQRAKLIERYDQLKSRLAPSHLAALTARYARALDRDPDDLHLLFKFASLEEERENHDAAISALRAVLKHLPDNVEAWTMMGKTFALKGDMAEARRCFDISLDRCVQPVETADQIAKDLCTLGEFKEAIPYCRMVLARHPHSAETLCNLGYALLHLGKHAEAIATLKQADELLPESVEIISNLAAAYLRDGDRDRSAQEFLRVVKLYPADARARTDLATVLQQLGQLDEALAHLSKAVDLDPANVQARLKEADLLARLSREREARTRYVEILKQRRGWPPALTSLAWLLATASDPTVRSPTEALRCAQAACAATHGQHAAAFDALAAAYAAEGLSEQAVQAAQKSIELADAEGNRIVADRIRARLKRFTGGGAYKRAFE